MSAQNSVTLNYGEAGTQAERPTFAIPEDFATHYQVRIIEAKDNFERRVGLFLASDRINPSLEIVNERIIAHKEDAQTVASLVKLAKHNGWKKIDIEGSPEFRKAAWAAATREGLVVSGYEPKFVEQEQEQAVAQRRQDDERRERQAKLPVANVEADLGRRVDAPTVLAAVEAAASTARQNNSPLSQTASLSAERDPSAATSIAAGEALAAQERAVVQRVFEQGLRELEAKGDPRAPAARETASALIDQIYGEQKERSAPLRDESAVRRPASEELAELFRHGAAEKITADPRLANAQEAQTVMELHIAEVFKGDAAQTAAANLESRKMISDVLRRGLDVSVREPAQVRQIEPIKNPEMER